MSGIEYMGKCECDNEQLLIDLVIKLNAHAMRLESCIAFGDAYISKLVQFATDEGNINLPKTDEQTHYEYRKAQCGKLPLASNFPFPIPPKMDSFWPPAGSP